MPLLSNKFQRTRLRALLYLASLCMACPAFAVDVLVTGAFRPDEQRPTDNTFQNTTPPSQYCQWQPDICSDRNNYVFDAPITVNRTYVGGDDRRKRFYVAFPAQREVTLQGPDGYVVRLTVAFSSYSGELTPDDNSRVTPTTIMEGGCSQRASLNSGTQRRFVLSITNPAAPSACYATEPNAGENIAGSYHSPLLGLGLRIAATSPLSLPNGVYKGNLTYSLGGAGADIDLGDSTGTSDNTLTLRFEFTVAHELKITRADMSDTVELRPDDQWKSWINENKVPNNIRGHSNFDIFTTGLLRVSLRCQHMVDDSCAMQSSNAGIKAVFVTSITIPEMEDENKILVNNLRLSPNRSSTYRPTGNQTTTRHSSVQFAVYKDMNAVVQPGLEWSGGATLIFESDF
jgi:hypothetical protein